MLISSLFLTNQQQKKVQFLQQMNSFPDDEYAPHALSKQLKWNYQPFWQLLQEIDQDLVSLGETPLLTSNKKIRWRHNPQRNNIFLSYQIQQSIPHQFLTESLIHPGTSLKEFADQRFLSTSTVTRRMRPLASQLEQEGISLNLAQMYLIGEEHIVRMSYIHYLWLTIASFSLYKQGDFPEEEQFLSTWSEDLRQCVPQQLCWLVLVVCRYRNEQNHHLQQSFFNELLFPTVEVGVRNYLTPQLADFQQVTRNVEFINYFIHYYHPVLTAESEAAKLRLAYYANKVEQKESFFLAIKAFYEYCQNQFLPVSLSKEDRKTCLCNFIGIFLAFSLQKGQFSFFSKTKDSLPKKLMKQYNIVYTAISNQLSELITDSEMAWLQGVLPELAHTLSLTILPYTEKQPLRTIRIGLVSLQDSILSLNIFQFLKDFPYTEVLLNPSVDCELDLYITSDPKLAPRQDWPCFIVNFLERDFSTDLTQRLLDLQYNSRL
ncbi:helix-turn-helix domain-containing protein [Enterococcus asini]|uniref:helix-turn-helix domain-containing protein n=1 Tax=Enterococcus asini TaxID=57732 RepID=UPI002892685B|nr:helix-turn-helix domain-containing protein [Enterococcus asini]MDT2757547.1 helix-turn-helix domain-containing protein [Enterococcus asini]